MDEQEQAEMRTELKQRLERDIQTATARDDIPAGKLAKVAIGCALACAGMTYDVGVSRAWQGKEGELQELEQLLSLCWDEVYTALEEQYALAIG